MSEWNEFTLFILSIKDRVVMDKSWRENFEENFCLAQNSEQGGVMVKLPLKNFKFV